MEWLDRFVSIMNVVSETKIEGMSITTIAHSTGLSKGTLHRMLSNMIDYHLIVQNPDTKKYRLGPQSMAWGSRFLLGQDPSRLLSGYCDDLAERTNLYTFLCRIDNGEVYCIYTCQPSKERKKYFVHVGQRMPIHCTAAAKSLIAFLPLAEVNTLFAQHSAVAFTNHTKQETAQLVDELLMIQKTRVAFCHEELELGVAAISTPIVLSNDQMLPTFSITLISDAGFIDEHQELLVKELLRVGSKASEYMELVQLLTSTKGM